jgi:hypothetical protein
VYEQIRLVLVVAAVVLPLTSLCGGYGDDDGMQPQRCEFTGITTTDGQGNVLSNDPDDWCPPEEAGTQVTARYRARPAPFDPRASIRFSSIEEG